MCVHWIKINPIILISNIIIFIYYYFNIHLKFKFQFNIFQKKKNNTTFCLNFKRMEFLEKCIFSEKLQTIIINKRLDRLKKIQKIQNFLCNSYFEKLQMFSKVRFSKFAICKSLLCLGSILGVICFNPCSNIVGANITLRRV